MADLRRRQTARRGGDAGIGCRNPGVGGDRCDRRRSADPRRPGRVPGDPDHRPKSERVDERPARHAAAAALGEVGARGAELGLSRPGDDGRIAVMRPSSDARRSISRSGRIGISQGLHADGVADGVGDRGRSRHGRDFADADAAAKHMVEAALVERRCRSAECRRCPACGSRRGSSSERRRSQRRSHVPRKGRSPILGRCRPRPGCAPARERRACRRRCRNGL